MPVYYGSMSLAPDVHAEPEALLKAGAQMLAEHDLAVKLDPTDCDHHSHLMIARDGTIAVDPSEHVCEHPVHQGKNESINAEKSQASREPVASPAPETVNKGTGKAIKTDRAIVMLNTAHGFVRPNILDAKLGVVLYDKDARAEKKARFDKVSDETTHKNFGFRIAGMRVWQGEGAVGEHVNSEGYRVYDKNYGRLEVNDDNLVDAFRNFLFSASAGIDEELGKMVSKRFLEVVQDIEQAIFDEDSEMFSASLLFVYEGDGEALKEALALEKVMVTGATTNESSRGSAPTQKEEDEYDEAYLSDEEEQPRISAVKLIDFAHAAWKEEGSGHDANSLKGVSSVADILAKIAGVARQPLLPRGREAKEGK